MTKAGKKKGRGNALRGSRDEVDLGSDKLYFKIGEVSQIVGVAAHVLRYWETEFSSIRPQKSHKGQRVYRRRDVETLLKIRHLLYDEKFTIAGARKRLREARDECDPAPPSGAYLAKQSLGKIKALVEEAQALVVDEVLDPTAADPAAFMRDHGGPRALAAGSTEPDVSLLSRPERNPR